MQADMQQSQRKVNDMDLKLRSLESTVAEKNSMIKVLQKKASESEMNVLSIPVHDSLSNSTILHSKQLSTTVDNFPNPPKKKITSSINLLVTVIVTTWEIYLKVSCKN